MKTLITAAAFLMSSATAAADEIDVTRSNLDATSGSASQCLLNIFTGVHTGYGLSADVTSPQACFDLATKMIEDFNYSRIQGMAILNGAHVQSFTCNSRYEMSCEIIAP